MKTRRPLSEASAEANAILAALRPVTADGLVAGSIRRRKPEVGDIEIVVAPRFVPTNLFGDLGPDLGDIEDVLADFGKLTLNGERWKQAKLKSGHQADIFIVYAPVQWGYRVAVLTGDAALSHLYVTTSNQIVDGHQGFLPPYLRCTDGAVHHGREVIPTPTEDSFLEILGLKGLPPELRNPVDARRWFNDHRAKPPCTCPKRGEDLPCLCHS